MHGESSVLALAIGFAITLFFNVYFLVLIARIPRSVRSVTHELERMNRALERRYPVAPIAPVEPPLTEDVLAERIAVLEVRRARGTLSEDTYAFERRRLESRLAAS